MDSFTSEIKKFWRLLSKRGKANAIIVIFILVIIFIYKVVKDIFYNADFLNGFFQNLFSDLIVGLFVGILIAFYFTKYMEEREKPILELWVEQGGEEKFSKTNISHYKKENYYFEELSLANTPIIEGRLYSYQFSLLIGNIGKKIGKFIKISLRINWDGDNKNYFKITHIYDDYIEPIIVLRDQNLELGKWTRRGGLTKAKQNFFYSNENLRVYSRSEDEEITIDWLEEIAKYELFAPIRVDKEKEVNIRVECTIQGEGSDIVHQHFIVNF